MTGQSQAHGSSAQAIETSVQVALRIRPIFTDSRSQNKSRQRADTEVLHVIERSPTPSSLSGASSGQHDQPQQVAVVPLQRHFTFDHIFGTGATQEEVYQGSVKRMVDKFMEGYNVTIMAYGQTSSGKTYTMGTAAPTTEDRGSSSEGIIPRAMTQLFQDARRPPSVYPGYRTPPPKTIFRVSFVEIYNEDLIDLLVKGDFRPPVTIREDTKGNIFWTGVQEIVVTSVEEVIHLLWFGSQNRQTHSTEMNEKSSRSHAIFSITLRQEKFIPTHPPPPWVTLNSKFHFVDLAGSERLKRTSAIGDRAKEGISINAGLHALGNVISALGDPSKKASHVPYRDSKLTRLLQDSLGGNALALMIACVSPSELNLGETLNTLKYANRARNIKNSSSLNQE
ncbi:P-loop containing nucleoside triphosphate hydrolase protein, partial [Gamsiella multidivaricata]|uniref:P-loop containing nucleoside triphosphate hydrolase protein n=1 Tax=Gamsiella multidivaricata TaxID=101098 RepID=UPI0022201811